MAPPLKSNRLVLREWRDDDLEDPARASSYNGARKRLTPNGINSVLLTIDAQQRMGYYHLKTR